MHLPEFSLFACAVGCLGGLECLFVDRFQGKVAGDIFQLAGLDVLAVDLGQRLTDVAGAEGSLVIGEVDERQLRGFLAFEGSISNVENDVLGFGWSGGRSSTQEIPDLLKLLLNCDLSFFDRLDLPSHDIQLLAGLAKAGLNVEDSQKG